eukprot:m.51679 g.51679  ORF g.51679 m.51679 type:complete len:631 (-) comp10746_c0_seq3:6178-8070(-)
MACRTMARVSHFKLKLAQVTRFTRIFQSTSSQNPVVSDELLEKLGSLSTQSLTDGLWVMGWPSPFIEGARPLQEGMKCVGRAVTVRFVPHRPDIAADKPVGISSPEYEAFELCGPKEILVMSSIGPWDSVGGDIKFLRLMQRNVGGLVTDGSVRDTDELVSYKFPVFSYSTTPKQGPAFMQPWECNTVVSCGGAVVRPGDCIVGDQDGVVVVPAAVAEDVYKIAREREEIEEIVKEELIKNPSSPGIYYPFKPPIKKDSALGKLLTSKGVRFMSTSSKPLGHGLQTRKMSSIPTTMKAIVVNETGPAECMQLETVPVPEVPQNHVLVKNEFCGVNFIDTYHRGGLYKRNLPFIAGQEGAGEIVHSEHIAHMPGSRVVYSVLETYSEYSVVPGDKAVPVPGNISLDTATACAVQGLTAHYLVTDAHAGLIKPKSVADDWMLIHGAGGGTCQWAAQMAKILGYNVIVTVSKSKASIAKATGADFIIEVDDMPGTQYEDYNSVDIVQQVMEITEGKGAKCVIDGIGEATYDISLKCLGQRGIFVTFGNASGPVPAFPPLRLIEKSAFVTRPKLLDYTRNRAELYERYNDIFEWITEGSLQIHIDRVFDLSQAIEAHKYLEEGNSKGKVILSIK